MIVEDFIREGGCVCFICEQRMVRPDGSNMVSVFVCPPERVSLYSTGNINLIHPTNIRFFHQNCFASVAGKDWWEECWIEQTGDLK